MTKIFTVLKISTYAPLWFLGIMVIFGVLGKLLNIGWLGSAPHVLMIPMLICYFASLIIGAIYGYLKGEDSVYLMALLGIGGWIVGLLISAFTSISTEIMYVINGIFLVAYLVLHILQYIATKKWETRILAVEK
ncbi:MAG: hypothetical protein KAR42_01680 [candidate division Zixibacteria bacterium]|nr:hypothetical protein [candidate division Zixibacteria bacterium]